MSNVLWQIQLESIKMYFILNVFLESFDQINCSKTKK